MEEHQAQAAARRKLRAAARLAQPPFAGATRLPPVWLMTDPSRTPDPAALAGKLPRGWGVIYRHFGAADRLETGRALARACRRAGLVLLVAADPALARRIGADGVHWPERMVARRLSGFRYGLATAAAHSRRALVRAHRAGADAALLSTVFGSRSPSAGAAMGALKFRLLVRAAPLPVYALGGVLPDNAARLFSQAGKRAAGWAAVDALRDAFG